LIWYQIILRKRKIKNNGGFNSAVRINKGNVMVSIFEIRKFTISFGSIATKRNTIKLQPQKSKQIYKMYLSNIKRYVDRRYDPRIGYKK